MPRNNPDDPTTSRPHHPHSDVPCPPQTPTATPTLTPLLSTSTHQPAVPIRTYPTAAHRKVKLMMNPTPLPRSPHDARLRRLSGARACNHLMRIPAHHVMRVARPIPSYNVAVLCVCASDTSSHVFSRLVVSSCVLSSPLRLHVLSELRGPAGVESHCQRPMQARDPTVNPANHRRNALQCRAARRSRSPAGS